MGKVWLAWTSRKFCCLIDSHEFSDGLIEFPTSKKHCFSCFSLAYKHHIYYIHHHQNNFYSTSHLLSNQHVHLPDYTTPSSSTYWEWSLFRGLKLFNFGGIIYTEATSPHLPGPRGPADQIQPSALRGSFGSHPPRPAATLLLRGFIGRSSTRRHCLVVSPPGPSPGTSGKTENLITLEKNRDLIFWFEWRDFGEP